MTMNKDECIELANSKYNGKAKDVIVKQIDNFFDIEESKFILSKNKYNVGDYVRLTSDNYLHGIGKNETSIKFVSENGILSKEATGDFGNHAFRFVVGLWRVKEDILLSDYIRNYSGIIAKYNDVNEQVPYGKLDEFVDKMRNVDHFLWKAESSMEVRFMPSLARDINQIGFILNLGSSYGKKLLKNDINGKKYDKKISDNFLREDLRGNFFDNKDNAFLERASYVVFGINKCFIEGIIVGRKYESDGDKISDLKELFPNSYICNLDGMVICE